MSHTPHDLAADFPEYADELQRLKLSNNHFQRLVDDYHTVNRAVHRVETDVEPTTDEHLSDLRKKRMALKDEIHAMLKSAKTSTSTT